MHDDDWWWVTNLFLTCLCLIPCFEDVFITQLELVVKKKLKIKITRNEGWFSESDLKNDLKWTPCETQQKGPTNFPASSCTWFNIFERFIEHFNFSSTWGSALQGSRSFANSHRRHTSGWTTSLNDHELSTHIQSLLPMPGPTDMMASWNSGWLSKRLPSIPRVRA